MFLQITTTCMQMRVATHFATKDGYGLVLGLINADDDNTRKFDCKDFSNFQEEEEILFFGGKTVLMLKQIKQYVGGWLRYSKYLRPLNAIRQMIIGQPITDEAREIVRKSSMKLVLRQIIRDVLRYHLFDGIRLQGMETPEYIWRLAVFQSSAIPIRLLYAEMLQEYKVFDCIKLAVNGRALNIVNIAVLFCKADSITFTFAREFILGQTACTLVVKDLIIISQIEAPFTIRLEWPSTIPSTMRKTFTTDPFVSKLNNCGVSIEYQPSALVFETHCTDPDVEFSRRVVRMIESLSRDGAEHSHATAAVKVSSNSGPKIREPLHLNSTSKVC